MAEPTLDASLDAGAPDPALHLKKRARRRLVGAIALALLGVIVLPLVMDREPPPAGPDIQVRIPSQEPVPAAAPGQNKPIGKPVAAPTQAAPKPALEAPATEQPAKPLDAASTAPEKSEPKPVATKPEDARADKAKPAADRARAEAALAGAAPTAPAPASAAATPPSKSDGEKWIVQLGAYQNAGNVNTLIAKLKEMRIPAYTEKFESPQGLRTRVRAGPFASREAAANAQERIKKILAVSGQLAPATADKTQ